MICFGRICFDETWFISPIEKSHGNPVVPLIHAETQYEIWKNEERFTEADQPSSLLGKNSPEGEDRDLFLSFFQKEKNKINASHIFLCIKWGLIGYICKRIKESFDLIYYGDTDRGLYIFNLLTDTLQHPFEGLV